MNSKCQAGERMGKTMNGRRHEEEIETLIPPVERPKLTRMDF